jgi:twitching motility two-component system response regulator PilH
MYHQEVTKILVADDSLFQQKLVATHLSSKGFVVVVAADALQAWMMTLRERPDAIVLDINMPGGTGIEVLKRLRMSIKTQHVPVIVASGNCEEEIEHMVEEFGVHEFLHKPIDLDKLCASLSQLLESSCTPIPQDTTKPVG